ncbi:MAG: radical SAM protein [Candidatus Aenigmarchaeota archaeon]|nr:radical SAM protein [Candidatus Aenigmarchaeota archaeon]
MGVRCQNFSISKVEPDPAHSEIFSPSKFIELAEKGECEGVSMSFSEPTTFFEFCIDVFKLAKKRRLYTTVITNGYFTPEALDMFLAAGTDAFNIDIKGDKEAVRKYCNADVEFVWQNAIEARKKSWVEITTLVIPGVNDDEACLRGIARRIHDELGDDVPWHLSRYYPAYKFTVSPTPIETLVKAREIGIEEGLNFVYIGNVPGHEFENTYCPSCKELLIQRYIFDIINYKITEDKKCPKCGEVIPIVGKYVV